MSITVLKVELTDDPLERGYGAMTDEEAAASLNTVNRTRIRPTMDAAEVYEQIEPSEFQALNDTQKQLIRDVLGLGPGIQIGPAAKARSVFVSIFGAESATITALQDAATESISRGQELGIGHVKVGHVQEARTS